MKKLLFILLILPAFSFGQKCKYVKDKLYKDTSEVRVTTESTLSQGIGRPNVQVWLKKINDNYTLKVYYSSTYLRQEISIRTEDSLFIIMENGEELIFLAKSNELETVNGSNGIIIRSISGTYSATPAKFEKLTQSKPLKFKIGFNDKYYTHKISNPELLQTAARCLLEK
ncbi:MAG: hypothetical protein M3Q58_05675 [Bacteroidota bacterium]|nr:hypothetical protein [Bacteroidota bacterium]